MDEQAIVFADIVGSTRLYERAGDDVAKRLITDLENEMAAIIHSMGGEVVEVVGDEVMFRFRSLDSAIACACQLHQSAETFSSQRGENMALRIGLHFGPILAESGRIYGDTVNVAARMAGIAQAGQIITTESVVAGLSPAWRGKARHFDNVRVKGKAELVVIYDLPWRRDDVTEIRPAAMAENQELPMLALLHRGIAHRVISTGEPFKIGRQSGNDIVVIGDSVSRNHASVHFGRGRFVLTDSSTNGTYVTMQDQECIYLRRESLPLWGYGRIGLGVQATSNNPDIIEFRCL